MTEGFAITLVICATVLAVSFMITQTVRKTLISKSHITVFNRKAEGVLAKACSDVQSKNLELERKLAKMESLVSAMSMQMGVRVETR